MGERGIESTKKGVMKGMTYENRSKQAAERSATARQFLSLRVRMHSGNCCRLPQKKQEETLSGA